MIVNAEFPVIRARHVDETRIALAETFDAMQGDVADAFDKGAERLVPKEWDILLRDIVREQNGATAEDIARRVAAKLGASYDLGIMAAWLDENARITAEGINATTGDLIRAAQPAQDDPVGHVFGILTLTGAASMAQRMVTGSAGFASHDAAEKSGAAVKRWNVNSRNPRSAHQRMNGQTVLLSENFSNGMAWPGDPTGGPRNNAECKCSLTFVR